MYNTRMGSKKRDPNEKEVLLTNTSVENNNMRGYLYDIFALKVFRVSNKGKPGKSRNRGKGNVMQNP